MRIGINVPDSLLKEFEPLRKTYNLSEICREAIKARVDSYKKAVSQPDKDTEATVDRLIKEYRRYEVDWEAIGQEDAKEWAKVGTLEDFEDLFHNISVHKKNAREPGPFLASRHLPGIKEYHDHQSEHEDWFEHEIDRDHSGNIYLDAQALYNRGWIAYLTAVWEKVKEGIAARERDTQKARKETLAKALATKPVIASSD